MFWWIRLAEDVDKFLPTMQVTFRTWGERKHPRFHSSIHPCYEGTLFIGHLMFLLQGLWWSSGRTYHFTRYGGGVLCHHLHSECHGFKHTHSHWAPVFVRDVVYQEMNGWSSNSKLCESPRKKKKHQTLLLKRYSNYMKRSSKHGSRIHNYSVIRWMDKILHQLKKVETLRIVGWKNLSSGIWFGTATVACYWIFNDFGHTPSFIKW